MTKSRVTRPLPIAVTALVAFLSAIGALAVSNGAAMGHGNDMHHGSAVSSKAVALRMDMRKLWEDHITWTRMAIISLEGGTPDTQATVGRLLKNQTDIGNAIKPFYGKAAGNAVTRLLREHILIAADVIAAAKAGKQADLSDAQARWTANADQIAAALHGVNPRNWKLSAMKAEMHRHLTLTTNEAIARLQGNWDADVAAYDAVHRHILHMADMLSTGIVKQFPARFR
jgi:hypothetical protein